MAWNSVCGAAVSVEACSSAVRKGRVGQDRGLHNVPTSALLGLHR